MDQESSPFRPGQPTPYELFTGRIKEIEHLWGMVKASTHGQLRIGFVTGERGIGKSSLASFVRDLAEQESHIAGCHVFLGGIKDLQGMLKRVFNGLLTQNIDRPWHQAVRDFFGDRIRKIGLFGVTLELDLKSEDLDRLALDFVPTIMHFLDKIKNTRKGLFLVLDDINGLASSDEFANWLKSTVDQIATSRKQIPLCILVVGLEDRRQELVSCQPSLARVFDLIDLAPWTTEEAKEFYRTSLHRVDATVGDSELGLLAAFTGGLPVLAHEIGDAVWRTASSPDIRDEDVRKGIIDAAENIGRKYLFPQIYRAIRSERYQSILKKIADPPSITFQRSAVMEKLSAREKRVFDGFLRRMKKLGALQSDPSSRGGYKFPNELYLAYFYMESTRAAKG